MIPSTGPLKLGARLSPWLGRVCVGVTFAALSAAACSVPQFEFPEPVDGLGTAGDGQVIINHCVNGLLDTDVGETDFDCGGGCPPCAIGQHCSDVADCAEGLCHEGSCIAEGCMNQVQDGVETDVDCGGAGCNPCVTGQGCAAETDCASGVCVDLVCLAPACDDQVKNGKETGTDCGGGCTGCPVDQPCVSASDCISEECTDGVCGPECPDGFANCNELNEDACEVNTRTDPAHCGSCGNGCDLPHATAECSAGECHVATGGCEVGFADCNGLPEDGCEVNLQQDKLNCGACNKACPELNGAPFCDAGQCQITCSTGFDDCDDNRDNGCEKDVSKDVNNCGECNQKCSPAQGGTAYCKNDACGETVCPAGFGDCNGDPDDGCEVDLRIDAKNCNTCGNLCVVANGTPTCNNRVCQIKSCDTGFDNCSGGYADGCETDLDTSTAHCGSCATPCSISNGVAKCDQGACAVNSCNGTFRDCNSDPDDGCEANTALNSKYCGGCLPANDCSKKYANASSTCSNSACNPPTCNSGWGDCLNGLTDGCETNTTNSTAHCGGCNLGCQGGVSAHVSTNLCVASQCDPKCSGAYDSCDDDERNGCEANTDTDEDHCGGCNLACDAGSNAHVTSNDCVTGACDPKCSGTYGNCNGNPNDGCETNTASSNANCGGCGSMFTCKQPADASAHVTSNNCSNSACKPVCSGLWGDCDSSGFNGCEHDVSADASNCGACDKACGTSNANSTSCKSGTCDPSCKPGWGKCETPEQGCVTPLGTTSNCTKCNEACSGATPFCDPGGCVAFRNIVVGNDVHAIGGWDGNDATNSELSADHTISWGKGNNRMLLLGVVKSDPEPPEGPYSATYGTANPFTLAVFKKDGSSQSYAAVYYMLDDKLPDAAGTLTQVNVKFWNGKQWGHGGFDLIELKNAQQEAPFATGSDAAGNCGGTATRGASVTFNQTGSLVYGVLAGRGATGASIVSSGQTETWYQQQEKPNNMVGAAAYIAASSSRTLSWNLTNCYNSAASIVAVRRLSASQ